MIFRFLPLVLSVIVFSPGLLCAQPASGSEPASTASARDVHKMYEDIEIMRHILDRKLHVLYPRNAEPNSVWLHLGDGQYRPMNMAIDWGFPVQPNTNNWQGADPFFTLPHQTVSNPPGWVYPQFDNQPYLVHEAGRAFEIEGVYLKGQGIVYTVTLSSLQPIGKVETAKPVSEWESVRRQLHHEKETPKKSETIKPPELSDVLLKVLAENGRHFSQLGENENLTLVITVHDKGHSTASAKSQGSAKAKPQPLATEEGGSSVSSKVRDLELLGDLHMKQEHYGQARDAFRQAIELNPGRKQKAALARKLTQAYLMLHNIKEAQAALNQAVALEEEDKDAKDKPAPAAKSATSALPIKLIISAPKKLLDQTGEGKISFEEFRRQAHVETLRFGDRRR